MAQEKLPMTGERTGLDTAPSSAGELAAFLQAARKLDPTASGRLMFALDATLSRQPAWDLAMQYQASMFDAVSKNGSLSVQLAYFRGFGECRASKWVMNAAALSRLMTGIECRGGQTQIEKLLRHAKRETVSAKLDAIVFIGDAMEENADALCHLAGDLALKGTRIFIFQEGSDQLADRTFREMARLTSGAWFRLGPNSARDIAELLGAIATYASGGRKALEARGGRGSTLLLQQMAKGKGSSL
ncbi:MAG: VWA domain-containing protein [Nitratireductor sp.]|nr:VWA domain-containing protein [Nitratireductor sp.]